MDIPEIRDLLGNPEELKPYVRTVLSQRQRRIIPSAGLMEAAVLVCMCWKDGEPHIILTRRSPDVEHHKGEISFPGGRAEENDSGPVHTALREAEEEIGLAGKDVEVLGLLDDHVSIVGYHITPVVGSAPYPYDFRINRESEELLMMPLGYALRDDVWMAQRSFFKGSDVTLYFLEIAGGVVWGATARMLKHYVDLLAGRSIPFGTVSDSARAWVMNLIEAQGSYRHIL